MNIRIYDANLKLTCIVNDNFISCFWSEGYNTIEPFVLELPDNYENKVDLDYYITRDDRANVMVVKSLQKEQGKITISGMQATQVLDDVAFIGTIKKDYYIDTAIATQYNKSKVKFPNVAIKTAVLHIRSEADISNKSYAELLTELCQPADIGFKISKTLNKPELVVNFYRPDEISKKTLREEFGNLVIQNVIESSENEKNTAYVLGQGTGSNRVVVKVPETVTGVERDLIIDARDMQQEEGETLDAYKQRLADRGLNELKARVKTENVSFVPSADTFGVDYDLGDTIFVYSEKYRVRLTAKVVKFSQKIQNTSNEISVEIGNIKLR